MRSGRGPRLARRCIHASRSAPVTDDEQIDVPRRIRGQPRQASNSTSKPLRRSPSAPMNTAIAPVTDAERLARAAAAPVRGDAKLPGVDAVVDDPQADR